MEPNHYKDFLTVEPPDRGQQDSRAWASTRSPQRSQYQEPEIYEDTVLPKTLTLHQSGHGRPRSPAKSKKHQHVTEETEYRGSYEDRSRSPRRSRKYQHEEEEIDEQPDLSIQRIQVESDEDLR